MRATALLTAALLAPALLSAACAEATGEGEAAKAGAPAKTAPAKTAPAKTAPAKAVPAKTAPVKAGAANMSVPKVAARAPAHKRAAPTPLEWNPAVHWLDFATAQARAKAEHKRVMLIIYADWCPRCKELAPAFMDAALVKLTEPLLMVKQEQDARPSWLRQFASHGSYVPRILFLEPDGTVNEAITSGHPRYPLFYTPRGLDRLKASMVKAAERGA